MIGKGGKLLEEEVRKSGKGEGREKSHRQDTQDTGADTTTTATTTHTITHSQDRYYGGKGGKSSPSTETYICPKQMEQQILKNSDAGPIQQQRREGVWALRIKIAWERERDMQRCREKNRKTEKGKDRKREREREKQRAVACGGGSVHATYPAQEQWLYR
jgi:hypothetical protein